MYDVRRRIEAGESLSETLTNTMDYCINHDIMKGFLLKHEQEVPAMYSLRWNEQAAREAAWEDGRMEERSEGIKAVITTAKKFSATKSQAIEQLMQCYSLTHDQALAAVQANW